MPSFRLRFDAAAILHREGVNTKTVVIPAGSVVATAGPVEKGHSSDRNQMVAVEWNGKKFSMFRLDLLERSDRAKGASQTSTIHSSELDGNMQ